MLNLVEEDKDFESKDEFYRNVSELVKKVVEGCCSDELDSDQLNEILNTIVLIFSDHTFPFSSDFNEGWIQFISRVVMNGTFSIDARTNAAELIVSFAEQNNKLVRKTHDLNEKLLKSFFEMLLDVPFQENINDWCKTLEDKIEEDESENCLFFKTKDLLSKYAIAIGEDESMRICMELVKTKMHNQDWKQRHAAFTFLSMILEGCKTKLSSRIEEFLRLILRGISDHHPRIKYAGYICMGLFITDQSPKIQRYYHSEILPQILSTIRTDPETKIKYIAVCSLINFLSDLNEKGYGNEETEELKTENLIYPYASDMIDTFTEILNNPQQSEDSEMVDSLNSEIFTSITCISNCIGEKFSQYISKILPGYVKQINTPLNYDQNKTKFDLKISAIQCAANSAIEISKSKEIIQEYKEEYTSMVEAIMSEFSQGSFIDNSLDDEKKEQVINLKSNCMINLPSFASILEDDFTPYTEKIMKFIKGVFENDVSVLCESVSDDTEVILEDAENFSIKTNFAQCLMLLINNLENKFSSYVEESFSIILNQDVWDCDKDTVKYIYDCCARLILYEESLEKKKSYLHKIIPFLENKLEQLNNEEDFDQLLDIIRSTKAIFEPLKNTDTLNLSEIEPIFRLLSKSCVVVMAIKETTIKEYEELDELKTEDDLIKCKAELDKYDELMNCISGFHENIVKTFVNIGSTSNIVRSTLFDHFIKNMNKSINTDDEIQACMCFFCDFIDLGSNLFIEATIENQEELIELFARCIDDNILSKERGYIQTVMYGIGSCAKRFSEEVFSNHAEKFISSIYEVIDAPDSRNSKNIESTDNAISSLFRICIYKPNCEYVTNDHLVKSLEYLPLTSEESEAKSINGLFIKKFKENDNDWYNNNSEIIDNVITRMKEFIAANPEKEMFEKEDIQYLKGGESQLTV